MLRCLKRSKLGFKHRCQNLPFLLLLEYQVQRNLLLVKQGLVLLKILVDVYISV